jgi:hypothetical protein
MADMPEKRKDRRYPIGESGIMASTNGRQEITPVQLIDVSISGFGVLANSPPPTDKNNTLRYSLLHKDFIIPLIIQWTQEVDDGYRIGCRRLDET